MATWNINELNATLKGGVSYNEVDNYIDFKVSQDAAPYLEEAKRDRDNKSSLKNGHMKKFATIPDVVSIDILQRFGLNIHDIDFMSDKHKLARLKYIIQTEYKHLMAY